jgi:hypothetical protein
VLSEVRNKDVLLAHGPKDGETESLRLTQRLSELSNRRTHSSLDNFVSPREANPAHRGSGSPLPNHRPYRARGTTQGAHMIDYMTKEFMSTGISTVSCGALGNLELWSIMLGCYLYATVSFSWARLGQARVRREGKKNVHAGVIGLPCYVCRIRMTRRTDGPMTAG